MKRLIAGMTAALLAAILAFSFKAEGISAQSAILMDCTTGRILFERSADRRSLIASTTKIMTALLVCEQCNVLDRMRVPAEAVGIEGSSMYLQEGEVLTVQELLYGLMLHSGNDAAIALAIYCAGTVEGFVEMMNDKAKTLGLTGTNFENPNGLDGEHHYSTARDLAVLASYAMENPLFAKVVSTKSVVIGNRTLRNHNKLLWQLDGAEGVKTGYTKAAGRILVSAAQRNGRRLIAVTIAAPNDWQDHLNLMESGFREFTPRNLVTNGDILGTVEIAGGEAATVELIAQGEFVYPLADGEQVKLILPQPGFVYAPVAECHDAGFAQIYVNGQWVGKVPVVFGQTIEQKYEEKQRIRDRLFGGKTNDRAYSKDIISTRCGITAPG